MMNVLPWVTRFIFPGGISSWRKPERNRNQLYLSVPSVYVMCIIFLFMVAPYYVLCIIFFFKKNVSRTLPKVCILRQNRLQLLNLIFSQLPWKINNKFNEKISELWWKVVNGHAFILVGPDFAVAYDRAMSVNIHHMTI